MLESCIVLCSLSSSSSYESWLTLCAPIDADVPTSSVLGIAVSCADVRACDFLNSVCPVIFLTTAFPMTFSMTRGNYLFQVVVVSSGNMTKILQLALVHLLAQVYFSTDQVLNVQPLPQYEMRMSKNKGNSEDLYLYINLPYEPC